MQYFDHEESSKFILYSRKPLSLTNEFGKLMWLLQDQKKENDSYAIIRDGIICQLVTQQLGLSCYLLRCVCRLNCGGEDAAYGL